jgi:hypothetical protein
MKLQIDKRQVSAEEILASVLVVREKSAGIFHGGKVVDNFLPLIATYDNYVRKFYNSIRHFHCRAGELLNEAVC